MVNSLNISRLKVVSEALSSLDYQFVFVGGAVLGVYCDDPARVEARPTEDIDVVVEILSLGDKERLDNALLAIGFQPDQESTVICRHKYQGITVDVMPTEERFLGFTNRWYAEGITNSVLTDLDETSSIPVFKTIYFLASKLEATKQKRAGHDFRMNRDFEDIVYLFDNTTNLLQDILQANENMKGYVREEIGQLLDRPNIREEIMANLEHSGRNERQARIIKIWQGIAE